MTAPGEKDLVFVFFRGTLVGDIHKFGSLNSIRGVRGLYGPNGFEFANIEWFERPPDTAYSIPGRLHWKLRNQEIKTLQKFLRSTLPSTKRTLWIGVSDEMAEDTQAAPVANDGPSMHDLVVAAVLERKEIGLKEYGTILQSHNGRDQLKDSIEEILDLACYLMAAKQERDALQASLVIEDAELEAMRSALKEKNREIELLEAKNRGLKKKLEESDEMITSEVASSRRALESALETARENGSKLANRSYAQKGRGDEAVAHIRKLEITMEVLGLPFDKYVDTEVH